MHGDVDPERLKIMLVEFSILVFAFSIFLSKYHMLWQVLSWRNTIEEEKTTKQNPAPSTSETRSFVLGQWWEEKEATLWQAPGSNLNHDHDDEGEGTRGNA